MFAFALADGNDLFVARDPIGPSTSDGATVNVSV